MLRPGEFYDVPPAVGRVLVSEGWAVELEYEQFEGFEAAVAHADDHPSRERSS